MQNRALPVENLLNVKNNRNVRNKMTQTSRSLADDSPLMAVGSDQAKPRTTQGL